MICITINQTTDAIPIAVADGRSADHGETSAKPSPLPRETSVSDKAAATNAPASTAPQETPEVLDSASVSASDICIAFTAVASTYCIDVMQTTAADMSS